MTVRGIPTEEIAQQFARELAEWMTADGGPEAFVEYPHGEFPGKLLKGG